MKIENTSLPTPLEELLSKAAEDVKASDVTFDDGETFQQKLDKGELTGPPGPSGGSGTPGPQGPAGPNTVSTTTSSDITGLLKGADGKVAKAVAGSDYVIPSGNVATSTKLQTPRKIILAGDATGEATFDGSGDITINVTVKGGGGVAVWG